MTRKEKKNSEYRGVRDEIKREHLKTKDMNWKEKLGYFWYYYKIHSLVAILVIIFSVTLIRDIVNTKDFNFYGIMLNSYQLSADKLEAAFSEYSGLDTENYECFIDTDSTLSLTSMSEFDLASSQKMIALMTTQDLDAVVFDSQVFYNYSNNEMFMDLRQVFTTKELKEYEDNLYYIDYAVMRAAMEAEEEELITYEEAPSPTPEEIAAEAETHKHPEEMDEPIPVGVFITDSPFAKQTGAYGTQLPVFGIVASTQRLDTAKQYLDFLWAESVDFVGVTETYE